MAHETTKRLGRQLQREFSPVVERPLNWQMIDALEALREVERRASGTVGKNDDQPASAGQTAKAASSKQGAGADSPHQPPKLP